MPTESDLKLLGNVRDKKLLEVGCGGGQCSIAFTKKGAVSTGIDLSEKQIEFAKKLATKEKTNTDFIVDNAEKLSKIKTNSMDIAFSAYALQYVNLRKCAKAVHRILKKNGIFVFSLQHPAWDMFEWGTTKVANSYFKKGLDVFEWDLGSGKRKAYTIRRTIQDMFEDITAAGFVVEKILEPLPVNKDKAHDFSYYKLEILKIVPSTIIFKCRKL